MRKFLLLAVMAMLCLVMLTGCELFYGDDGKAYIRFTLDSEADGGLIALEGFPGTVSPGTDYEIQPGSYAGQYVLYYHDGPYYEYWSYYDEYLYTYYTMTNDTDGTFIYTPSYYSDDADAFDSNVEYYQDEGLFADYANGIDYYITVEDGELFQDGDDSYFELKLLWDPADSDFGPRGLASDGAKVLESTPDKVVKEYSDGRYTVRLEMRRNPAVEGSVRTPILRQ